MLSTHDALIHAVTEYDRKQSTKPGFNRYALPQYFARIEDIDADIANGANPVDAVKAAFSGRLLNVCLKTIGAPKATDADQRGGLFYTPASERATR